MRLFRLFLAHELTTQWRSMRFRGLAAVYVLAASIPPVMIFVISGRVTRLVGPAAYNALLLTTQPLLTSLVAVGLAVDAMAREREEGSFSVLAVAPISSIGYLMRRWLAVVALCIPLSLIPTAVSAALAIHSRDALPLLLMFAEGWLVAVLPALLVGSALAIALGTITSRTVLAIIFGAVLITAGIGILDNFLYFFHLSFDGPGDLFAGGQRNIQELMWTIRGFWFPRVPSDAAFPLRGELRALPSRAGITATMAVVLLAASAFYLRRTRRDLRPWKVSETHQLRTLLATVNRIREEYALDAGSGTADRVVLAVAIALAALLVVHLVQRTWRFAALAEERYAAESASAIPTSTSIVAERMRIDGSVALSGAMRSRASLTIRNSGASAQSHLSFMLNAGLDVRTLAVDRGAARSRRVWQRLDVELAPPLAPAESRTLVFDLDGVPAEIDFALQPPGNFGARWNRYRHATQPIYLTDLTRSNVFPAASELRMNLRSSDIAPLLRYSPWALRPLEEGEGFIPETIDTPAAIEVHFRHPYPLAVDSCGTISVGAPALGRAPGTLTTRCTIGLVSYGVFGGPLAERAAGAEATLAYIPAHAVLAPARAQSLASSIRLATEVWPQLALPPHLVFVERPTEGDERNYNAYMPWRTVEQIGGSGGVFFVPELVFTTTRPIDASVFAASIIAGTLRAKRRVVAAEAAFFTRFYTAVAIGRLGMRKGRAVDAATAAAPETAPLLNGFWIPESRMWKVLASLEYRVGAGHFADGINDFANAGGAPGTAKELLAAIGRRAGVDLTRAYDDYFAGTALPELTLSDVTFRRDGERWIVAGSVKNNGTGEAFVPVALRTSQGSLWQTVRVDSQASAPFTFAAPGEPHAVQLDPDGVCYRRAVIGAVENVDYRGVGAAALDEARPRAGAPTLRPRTGAPTLRSRAGATTLRSGA